MLQYASSYSNAHSTSYASIKVPVSSLLDKALEGDDLAFAELIRQHHQMLQRMAFRITKNTADAEDVIQEAFLRAYRNLHTFKGDAKFSTWLSRITINTALMHLRRQRRLNETSIDTLSLDGHSSSFPTWLIQVPQDHLQNSDRSKLIMVAIKRLPEQLRKVMELRIIHQLSTCEAATRLGLTSAAVKARMHRGKKRVQKDINLLLSRGYQCAQ